MAKQYRSREGEVTAADTKTQLTTLGSETAPGPLLVPQGVSTLLGAIIAFGARPAATSGGGILIRLEGPGLPAGPEVIAGGAAGSTQTASTAGLLRGTYVPIGVTVTPANEILIFAEQGGVTMTRVPVAVTLVFS